ncbi:MAG: winged helix-turn-helix transcriptional regulator [Actinobacteria bacterium]|nr:winged helix-turn-helix transcriptional regulator [Actinomycetota bacterium]
MPVYAAPSLAPAVERAIDVLGANAARVAVLAYVVEHPGCLVSEIAEGSGLAVGTVKTHVATLAALGALSAEPAPSLPYSERRGRRTRYTARHDALAEHYRELGRLLRLVGDDKPRGASS